MYHSLMLLAGMLWLFRSSYLPSIQIILVVITLSIGLWGINRYHSRLVAIGLFGFCWAAIFAGYSKSQDLPQALVNEPARVVGCITHIKNYSPNYQRLRITIDQTYLNNTAKNFDGKISIGNYKPLAREITPGWCGEFAVVLKPVHGRLNSRGFDYEAWAYVENIKAIGTLRSASELYPGDSFYNRYLRSRFDLSMHLKTLLVDSSSVSIVLSLAVGDRNLMTQEQWTLLRRTGTSHLLAISGLHIGLVFWIMSMFASLVWRLIPAVGLILPAQKAGWICGLVSSLAYLVLAGLPLSGQRAWVMLLITSILLLSNEKPDFSRCLFTALTIVLVIWPSSVLAIGFWFTFAAVGLILLHYVHVDLKLSGKLISLNSGIKGKISKLLAIQFILSMAMLPLTLLFFGEISLVSPVANIFAIPLICFVVLPGIFLGITLSFMGLVNHSKSVFTVVQYCLDGLSNWLESLVKFDWSWSMPVIHHHVSIVLMGLGIFLWLYFKYWPGKWMLCLIAIPVFINSKPELPNGEFSLSVFDVGQGLAIWIKTADKNLLVDTGFGTENGFNYFDSVIYPVMKANGVQKLDAVVISHGDADHAGGLSALMGSELKPELVIGSEKNTDSVHRYCKDRFIWYWNGVKFQFLTQQDVSGDNNQSCVLKLSTEYGSVLLPGDIEREAEQRLVVNYSNDLNTDVLIVPHHGSQTSSTKAFIQAVSPELAIFSAGYLNRYGHPAEKVLNRYQHYGIDLLNTACQGQITVNIKASGIRTKSLRQTHQPFWRHQCSNSIN